MRSILITKLSSDFYCLNIMSEKPFSNPSQGFDFEKHTFFLTEQEIIKLKTECDESLKLLDISAN